MTPNKEVRSEKKDNPQKLSYEQLNEACAQLYQQNQNLVKELNRLNLVNTFKRLDYLFKVVECAPIFKDGDFVNECMDEIKEALTPKTGEQSAGDA